MKKNKEKGLRFILGTFDENKFKGRPIIVLRKKTQVVPRTNLILRKYGYVWLKVVYGKDEKGQPIFNHGTYQTSGTFKFALSAFIEQALIDQLIGGLR